MKRRRKSIKEKCEKTIYTWITTSIGGRVFFQRGNLSSKNCWGQPCLSLDILFVQHQELDVIEFNQQRNCNSYQPSFASLTFSIPTTLQRLVITS
ncbi:hypothetical protein JHK82_017993 [Glycine max]|nr:hypothetical protein JHK85_018462 [Glycine max]KAG5037225.1 hypothetical protein JHK86_018065 [Glycine max]KAG5142298.1 hypothetical protein JHK82_017993 [Glycine max]